MSDQNPLHPAEAAESSIFWFYDNLIYKIKNEEKENLSMAKEKKKHQIFMPLTRDRKFGGTTLINRITIHFITR